MSPRNTRICSEDSLNEALQTTLPTGSIRVM